MISGCGEPRGRERQVVITDNQPALRGRIAARQPELGHLPVTHLRAIREFVQAEPRADPTGLVVDDDVQQAPPDHFRSLLAWTLSGSPSMADTLVFNVFSH